MRWRTFRIRDDRGAWRDVPYRAGGETWSALSPAERRGLDAARDIQWLKRLIASPWLLVMSWVIWGLSLAILIEFIRSTDRRDVATLVVLAAIVAAALLWVLYYRRLMGLILARSIVALEREVPMCATCGYCLAGLDPAADGCTVCPECGAAWRVSGAKELP